MNDSKRPADTKLVDELQLELRRLQSERSRAIAQRDRVYSVVETGDDTGRILVDALAYLKSVEKRIEQVSALLAREQRRAR